MTEKSSGKLADFDTRNLVCIEYPGYIKNVDQMLKTIGGEESLSKTYFKSKRRIELHFRPEDPYCHSVCGDLHDARALLVKVRRRRKKRQPGDETDHPWEYEQKVCGIVHKAYRFQSLMDFQYLAPKPLHDTFKDVLTSSFLDEEQPLHVSPAIFARIDVPGNYNYQPEVVSRLGTKGNPVHKKQPTDDDDLVSAESVPRIRKRRPGEAVGAIYSSDEVPTEPLAKNKKGVEELMMRFSWVEKAVKHLRQLFEERQMWTRGAVVYHIRNIPEVNNERIKQLLPYVAYYWINGPWRTLWTKFGYDPRKDPEAKMYQLVDFRVRYRRDGSRGSIAPLRTTEIRTLPVQQQRHRTSAAVNVDRSIEPQMEESGSPSEESKLPPEELPYTFHADKLPRARQIMYQICDLYDDDIRAIVSASDNMVKTCQERSGWFKPDVVSKIRNCISKKVDIRAAKELQEIEKKKLQNKGTQDETTEPESEIAEEFSEDDYSDNEQEEADENEADA